MQNRFSKVWVKSSSLQDVCTISCEVACESSELKWFQEVKFDFPGWQTFEEFVKFNIFNFFGKWIEKIRKGVQIESLVRVLFFEVLFGVVKRV